MQMEFWIRLDLKFVTLHLVKIPIYVDNYSCKFISANRKKVDFSWTYVTFDVCISISDELTGAVCASKTATLSSFT